MKMFYLNHLSESIDLDSKNIILQYQELFDYSWDVETKNGTILSFYRKSASIPITVTVIADTQEEYVTILHNFHSIIEKDIVNKKPGRLYVGTQYLMCYISSDLKSDAFMGVPIQKKYITVVTDYPFWISESTYNFYSYDTVLSFNNKNYPGRYSYRYANGLSNAYIQNPHFTDANFDLIIYGPAVNPQVTIGEIPYLVNIVLEVGEYLKIDSRAGTVTKVMVNGETINAFHNRQKGRTFFRKIPPGRHAVSWPGTFAWDLIIYEERSEPKWNV